MDVDNIEEKKSKYYDTRKRISIFKNVFEISDREIIEKLADEIEQYRKRIQEQNNMIDELSKKTIHSEECILDTADELIDQDIVEIISTTQYGDGKPIQSKIEYKYKDTSDTIINNKNENAKAIKAIYHAEIYETNDGTIEILYECDKDRCTECDKKNCYKEYCTHTLNKKYAKNYYNKES